MRCRPVQTWLRENGPGLGEEVPESWREHLAACPACQAVAQRQARLAGLLVATAPPPPVTLRPRVLAALRPRGPVGRVAWRAVPLAVAGLLLVVMIQRREPSPLAVGGDELRAGSYVQQHATLVSTEPLADATALNAIGALSLRGAVQDHDAH